jgi:hypothetical protein
MLSGPVHYGEGNLALHFARPVPEFRARLERLEKEGKIHRLDDGDGNVTWAAPRRRGY